MISGVAGYRPGYPAGYSLAPVYLRSCASRVCVRLAITIRERSDRGLNTQSMPENVAKRLQLLHTYYPGVKKS